MVKSPTSILNSIQKMKNNLKNDKQQLKIIKNNLIITDHYQLNINHSKSQFYNHNHSSLYNRKIKQLDNKENIQSEANLPQVFEQIHNNKSCQCENQNLQISRLTLELETENYLNDNKNFNSKVFPPSQDNSKESTDIKIIVKKHQEEISNLKQVCETQKASILNKKAVEIKRLNEFYENQIQQMKDEIYFLQFQLSSFDNPNKNLRITDPSVLVELTKEPNKLIKLEKQTQTVPTSKELSVDCEIQLDLKESKLEDVNSNENNLIESLCFKYFGASQFSQSVPDRQRSIQLDNQQRKKYEQIINKLLQQNTKLYLRIEKLYAEVHSSQNMTSGKMSFFKNFGLNYKTASSHALDDSNDRSSATSRSKLIGKYFSSNLNKQLGNIAQFSSQQCNFKVSQIVSNQTHRQCSKENKRKNSIIYRISNGLQTSMLKQNCNNSSRSKIPVKKPPIKPKSGINLSLPLDQRRLKTQYSSRQSQFISQNFSSIEESDFDTIGLQKKIESQQKIPTIRQKIKNEPSFKFYDEEPIIYVKKQKKIPSQHEAQVWEVQSENQIKNDEIKLKTIKNFRCLPNLD